ncbi:MAG: proliferating cell nuclear antigen (pcna) [Nanobdellota archaeon]
MKLSLAEPKYLKESISIISELVTEARFKITKDAMELVAMDPANVAMIVFKLMSSSFVEYDVEKESSVAINLGNLKQVLKRAKGSDTLNLKLDDGQNKLVIELIGSSTRTFSLPIIELEEKEQKVPQLSFPVTINTTSSSITEAVEDVDIVAESVSFSADQNSFTIEGEGDLSKANIEMKPDEETKIVAENESKVKAKYSIEYLKKMIAASKLSDNVKIQFSNDYPLKMEFVDVDKVMLSFILAPRVDND